LLLLTVSTDLVKDSLELEIEGVNGADANKDVLLVNPSFTAVPGSDLIENKTDTITRTTASNSTTPRRTASIASSVTLHNIITCS
jgi:hypothetical protein